MAMITKPTIQTLSEIETLIDSARVSAELQDKHEFWQRDKAFIDKIRKCILSNERNQMQWAFDQLRNLSQGFGSYCKDSNQLNSLLDRLFDEFKQLLIDSH